MLVEIHQDIFEHLLKKLLTPDAWLDHSPSDEMVVFFEEHRKLGTNPFMLSYKLGNDLDFLMNKINRQLAAILNKKLENAFGREQTNMPLPLLAVSISTMFIGMIVSWFTSFQSIDAFRFAGYIQRNISNLVTGAFER